MISKELLSEVLGIPLQHIRYNDTTNLYEIFKEDLFNWSDGSYGRWSNLEVNIYELAHKCKTWAHSNGYWLSVRLYEPNGFNIVVFSHIHSQLQKDLKEINDKTEPEAVFKACQWILDKDSK